MTHPLFRSEMFVETAFERRFQAMLRSAWHKRSWHKRSWHKRSWHKRSWHKRSWHKRSWHVIVADPGSGKSMGIRDLIKRAGGRSVLAVTSPKNNDDEQALGDQLFSALGLPLRGHWRTRKRHHHGTPVPIRHGMPDCG